MTLESRRDQPTSRLGATLASMKHDHRSHHCLAEIRSIVQYDVGRLAAALATTPPVSQREC
jgi:hypothetical protein